MHEASSFPQISQNGTYHAYYTTFSITQAKSGDGKAVHYSDTSTHL